MESKWNNKNKNSANFFGHKRKTVAWKKRHSEVAPWRSTKLTGRWAARRHGVRHEIGRAGPWWSVTSSDSLQHRLAAFAAAASFCSASVPFFVAACAPPPNDPTERWGLGSSRESRSWIGAHPLPDATPWVQVSTHKKGGREPKWLKSWITC